MKRINNSNFELLQDVIKELEFNYVEDKFQNIEKITSYWVEVVGSKISKFSKVFEYSTDNVLTIACADSFVANELYLEKDKLLKMMNSRIENLGIKIEDIKFNYKKWKEQNDV